MEYVIIEQAEGNEALITRVETEEDVENYQSLQGGDFIILSTDAFNNMCMTCVKGK